MDHIQAPKIILVIDGSGSMEAYQPQVHTFVEYLKTQTCEDSPVLEFASNLVTRELKYYQVSCGGGTVFEPVLGSLKENIEAINGKTQIKVLSDKTTYNDVITVVFISDGDFFDARQVAKGMSAWTVPYSFHSIFITCGTEGALKQLSPFNKFGLGCNRYFNINDPELKELTFQFTTRALTDDDEIFEGDSQVVETFPKNMNEATRYPEKAALLYSYMTQLKLWNGERFHKLFYALMGTPVTNQERRQLIIKLQDANVLDTNNAEVIVKHMKYSNTESTSITNAPISQNIPSLLVDEFQFAPKWTDADNGVSYRIIMFDSAAYDKLVPSWLTDSKLYIGGDLATVALTIEVRSKQSKPVLVVINDDQFELKSGCGIIANTRNSSFSIEVCRDNGNGTSESAVNKELSIAVTDNFNFETNSVDEVDSYADYVGSGAFDEVDSLNERQCNENSKCFASRTDKFAGRLVKRETSQPIFKVGSIQKTAVYNEIYLKAFKVYFFNNDNLQNFIQADTKLKQLINAYISDSCYICLGELSELNSAFYYPCYHVGVCASCYTKYEANIKICGLCRSPIKTVKLKFR